MYSSSKADNTPPPDAGKYIRVGIIAIIIIAAFVVVGHQGIIMLMNVEEFADLFTTPLYFSLISGLILAAIALVRVNVVRRASIGWYVLQTFLGFMSRQGTNASAQTIPLFGDFKISGIQFAIWQVTKVLLFGAFFANLMFGFSVVYLVDGNDLGIDNIPTIFSLPFVTPPTDHSYATEKVVPMIPALLVLVPPLLGAIGTRLLLYIGVHHIIKTITAFIHDSTEGKPKYLSYVSTLEAVIGIGVLWAGFNMFFGNQIDYNTKYAIGGTLVVGLALIAFSFLDRMRSRILTHMLKRDVYIRIITIVVIALIVGIAMSVNNSVADAKKIEYLGPYNAQQIGVNRYLGELD